MTPTAWKVIALTLSALLLVTVGVLIGTNLGDDGRDATQSPSTPGAPTDASAPPPTAVQLGDRFGWCAELQASWDALDNLSIADEQPMWAAEVRDYVDNIDTEANGDSERMEVFPQRKTHLSCRGNGGHDEADGLRASVVSVPRGRRARNLDGARLVVRRLRFRHRRSNSPR